MTSIILIVVGSFFLCIGLGPWHEPTYDTHWKDAYLIAGGVMFIAFGLRAALTKREETR